MKTIDDARQLAQWLVAIAERNGVRTEALLTPMSTPLGRAVGNANEVIESIETLKGRGPADVEALSVRFAARMLVLAGHAADESAAEQKVNDALTSGAGLEKFKAIIEAQGGDARVVDDYARLPQPSVTANWTAASAGTITQLDAELIGRAAVALGAGRDRADAGVDPAAGIEILAPVGTPVSAGAPVLKLMAASQDRLDAARIVLQNAVGIGARPPEPQPFVLDTISR